MPYQRHRIQIYEVHRTVGSRCLRLLIARRELAALSLTKGAHSYAKGSYRTDAPSQCQCIEEVLSAIVPTTVFPPPLWQLAHFCVKISAPERPSAKQGQPASTAAPTMPTPSLHSRSIPLRCCIALTVVKARAPFVGPAAKASTSGQPSMTSSTTAGARRIYTILSLRFLALGLFPETMPPVLRYREFLSLSRPLRGSKALLPHAFCRRWKVETVPS